MRNRRALLTAMAANNQPFEADYYVSYSLGDDNNDGLTTATPWKHHPWDAAATGTANAATLAAGEMVAFRQEIHWGVYITTPGGAAYATPVTAIGHPSWGSGGAIISGAVDPSTLTWTADGGSYKCTLATEPTYVVYGSTVLTKQAGAGNTVGANKFDWSANTLYVNVGEDPSSGTLKAANSAYVALVQKGNVKFQDVTIELGNGSATVFGSSVPNITFQNCTLRYCKTPLFYAVSGADHLIDGCTFTYSDYGCIRLTSCTTPTITNNTISSFGAAGGTVNTSGLLLNGGSDGAIVHHNTIRYCPGYGINVAANNCEIYQNTIYGNGRGNKGHAVNGGAGIYFSGNASANKFYRNNCYSNYVGVYHVTGGGTGGNQVYYNLVLNSTVNSIDNEGDPGVNPFEVYNNTVIHNPSVDNIEPYTGHGIATQLAGKVNKVANNIVAVMQVGDNCNGICVTSDDAAFVYEWIDHNLYYLAVEGAHIGMHGLQYYDLATWQSVLQADAKVFDMAGNAAQGEANGIEDDPLFVNAAGGNYRLSLGSPAIGAGVDVGLTVDYNGNAVGNPPCIGAFEYA